MMVKAPLPPPTSRRRSRDERSACFARTAAGPKRTGMLTAAKGLGAVRITHEFLVLAPYLRAAVAPDQRGEVAERRIDEPVCLESEVVAEIVRSARHQVIVTARERSRSRRCLWSATPGW